MAAPKVGLGAVPLSEVAVMLPEPAPYPKRVVIMVAVDEVPGATPFTVTTPVLLIETLPFAVAVPP